MHTHVCKNSAVYFAWRSNDPLKQHKGLFQAGTTVNSYIIIATNKCFLLLGKEIQPKDFTDYPFLLFPLSHFLFFFFFNKETGELKDKITFLTWHNEWQIHRNVLEKPRKLWADRAVHALCPTNWRTSFLLGKSRTKLFFTVFTFLSTHTWFFFFTLPLTKYITTYHLLSSVAPRPLNAFLFSHNESLAQIFRFSKEYHHTVYKQFVITVCKQGREESTLK